jgi:flavin reductase (DIM6/NTAB) family NADH-FMN oxidoreductase RutF
MADHAQADGGVDPASFRALMSAFPSGVAVVTAADGEGRPFGLTCSSLCSVSLEPPLLLVCVRSSSRTLSMICRSGAFGVNFLHARGREAAELFASSVADRFRLISWRPTVGALPCLPLHAHAVAECGVRAVVPGGDHTVVIGEVTRISRFAATPPLLHGLRQYVGWPDLELADLSATGGPAPGRHGLR